MTVTEPELLAALETLKSAMSVGVARPSSATVWAELWTAAAHGLQAAMDDDARDITGSDVPPLPASNNFMQMAKAQASVLHDLFSIALEHEPEGTWGVSIPILPLLPGRSELPGNGQLHSAFHIFQAADEVLSGDHGLPAARSQLVDGTAHYLDVARHYVGLLSEDLAS